MGKTVYLSGKIFDVENYNIPKFYEIEFNLKKMGYEVLNPIDFLLKLIREKDGKIINPQNYEDIIKRVKENNITEEEFEENMYEKMDISDYLVLFDDWKESEKCKEKYIYFFISQNKPIYEYVQRGKRNKILKINHKIIKK